MFIEIEEMMMITVWIWWTYWVMRAIDLKFNEKRWRKERELEKELLEEQKKERVWEDERSKLN